MEYLHETSVGDMLKVIDAIGQVLKTEPENGSKLKGVVKGSLGKGKAYKGSITSQANKLCMTFPVLCSNTVTPSTASMISKAIERKCTLMLHQLFAADMLVAGANSGGIEQKINGVYTGIDFDTLSVDDMINITSQLSPQQASMFESAEYVNEIKELAQKKLHEGSYESSVNEYSVSLYKINEAGQAQVDKEMIFNEAKRGWGIGRQVGLDYGLNNEDDTIISDKIDAYLKNYVNNVNPGTDGNLSADKLDDLLKISKELRDRSTVDLNADKAVEAMKQSMLNRAKTQAEIDKINADIEANKKKIKIEIEKNERERARAERDAIEAGQKKRASIDAAIAAKTDQFKKTLMDTDVKKVNELVPSMLIVNYAIDVKNGEPIVSSAIVGVKARLVALDSFQILEKLASKNKDKSGLVKFIKATTGEIKFLKDFVLALDKAKIDALSRSKRGSANPIWRVLERRAAVNNLRRALGQKNDASPITTLVITQEEVDYLRKTAGMEMDNVNTANYILNAYNLMGLCIVDETTEVAKFLFDGEFNQFDTYAFGSLERESAGDNGMYKKVINLMAKRM